MTHTRSAVALAAVCLLLAAMATGCHFPREPLYPDASVEDIVSETPPDVTVPDAVDAIDARLDVTPDVAPDASPDAVDGSTCPFLDPTTDGFRVGGSLVVSGSTVGQRSALTPPTLSPGCTLNYSTNPAPERMVRHTMSAAGRLHVTTDAPTCEGVFDTILHAYRSCDPMGAAAIGCDDDDRVLSSCTAGCTGGCPGLASSLLLPGLTAGQTVFVAVDGYAGRAGRFRVVLTENGLNNAPPPSSTSGLMIADRCGCQDPRDNMVSSPVMFPSASDTVVGTPGRMQNAGDGIRGTRTLPFASIGGVALRFRVGAVNLMTTATCTNARAIVDLQIADRVVQSFEIDRNTPTTSDVRVVFQTFTSIAVAAMTPQAIALRLREITPASCGSIDISRATGELHLLGR